MTNHTYNTATRAEIASIALFSSADLDSLEPMLQVCSVQTLVANEVLIALGDKNNPLYLILSGRLGIHLTSPETKALTLLGVGEMVGEISLIDRQPASAYVIAAESSRVLLLDEELLWLLADASHAVAYNLLRTLASRLRTGNQIIQNDREKIEKYKFHASVDGLTGLYNRFWMDKMLLRQMDRSNRDQEKLTLLLIDVDHFKKFNDQHGHVAGDYALREVAACIRNIVRPTDQVARYGGEEFAVILPKASLENAIEVASRLCQSMRTLPITNIDGSPLPCVTVSIGAAEMPDNCTPEAFIELADKALYRAKNNGRNQVLS